MALNNVFFVSHNWLARVRAVCASIALWMAVCVLCLISIMLLRLGVSASAREGLYTFLSHHPFLVACSALLPLAIAGRLITYLCQPHASYTFHSSLLSFDVNPNIIASSIEMGWNREHSDMPIVCQVVSMGRSLKVSITADAPPKEFEKQRAEELHTLAMEKLQTLLVARHPITFHIQWTPKPNPSLLITHA